VLAAVIVPDSHLAELDDAWRTWKQQTLGSSSKLVHEPDTRNHGKSFWLDGNYERRQAAFASLSRQLETMDFTCAVCVVNREEYIRLYGEGPVDKTLPQHLYLMALTFLMERIVMILDANHKGARARIIAEARGPKDDAFLQYEFVRLHLDGTSYVSAAWFRQQLEPAIRFVKKTDNNTGLQLADLLARPCGEKVLNPTSTPTRWPQFRDKLCQGQETTHSILGFKIFPWDNRYIDIWTS